MGPYACQVASVCHHDKQFENSGRMSTEYIIIDGFDVAVDNLKSFVERGTLLSDTRDNVFAKVLDDDVINFR